MDERTTHDDDDFQDSETELENTEIDDDTTPADTDDESDEPKKAEKEKQKLAWLKKIESGEKTLDDMPKNLHWLKKDIEAEIKKPESPKKPVNEDELASKIRKALQEERAQEDFDVIVQSLQESKLDSEKEAQLREEYEYLISEFPSPTALQKLKVLQTSMKIVGVKSESEAIRERRRKGMTLPPFGSRKRNTVNKDEMTEIEKRLSGNLPPGFKA